MYRMERFEENMRFESERTVWQWCSRLLRPAWERLTFGRVDILVGIAPVFGFTNEELHGIGVAILSGMSFTSDFVLNAMDGDPATLLYLALRGIELEDIRKQFCVNRRLDAISKMTLARERQYGDLWTEEGMHSSAMIAEWEESFRPLKMALTYRFEQNLVHLTDLLAEIIPGDEIDEHYDGGYSKMASSRIFRLRKTPRYLLNLVTRLRLRNLTDQVQMTMDSEELVNFLLAAIPGPVVEAIERDGYEPLGVIEDFLNHDMLLPRESLLALDPWLRPPLP